MRIAMKRILNKTVLLVLTVLLIAACSSDPELFDKSDRFVAFNSGTAKVLEDTSLLIPVVVGAFKGSSAVTVSFEVVAETGTSIAKEGVDFNLDASSVVFADGFGTQYIKVTPVNNDVFTGNKTFTINLKSNTAKYPFGAQQTVLVSIIDDEHPLKNWIGNYSVSALSYGDPGNWDESWSNVSTAADPDDVNSLIISGLANGNKSIVATFDLTAMTITIKPGVNIGSNSYNLGNMLFYLGVESLSSFDKEANIVGTISNDGSIVIDHISPVVESGVNKDVIWDTFKTVWTKK